LIETLVLLFLFLFFFQNQFITGQNIYPTTPNTPIYLDGGAIDLEMPVTTGGWARGVFNQYQKNTIGGVGMLGGGTTPRYYFMAHGSNPWSSGLGLYVKTDGSVGIGTTNPQNKLDVCGKIRGTEVIVEEGWCDFVFDEDYNLKSIEEEQEYIVANGYLSGFESEETMAGEINVGNITKRQQQKIEEQMLYIIQLNEKNKSLEEQNENFAKMIKDLAQDVKALQEQIQK